MFRFALWHRILSGTTDKTRNGHPVSPIRSRTKRPAPTASLSKSCFRFFRYGAKKRESLHGWTSLEIPYIIYIRYEAVRRISILAPHRAEKGGHSLCLSQKRHKSTASPSRDQTFLTIFVQKVRNRLIIFYWNKPSNMGTSAYGREEVRSDCPNDIRTQWTTKKK